MAVRKIILVGILGIIIALPGSRFAASAEKKGGINNVTIFEKCPAMEQAIFLAEEALRDGDAEKCIIKYQEAVQISLDVNPRAMYVIGGDTYVKKTQYLISGIEYCHRALMKLDDQSLAIYQRLYEQAAVREMRKFVERKDYSGLLALARRYPFTESGLLAQEWAANIALESGDYDLAAMLYNKVIAIRTNWPSMIKAAPGSLAVVLAKAAQASARKTNITYLKNYRAILDQYTELNNATISIEKRERRLGEYVDKLIKDYKPLIKKPIVDRPFFGGNFAGNAIMDGSEGKIGVRKWTYEVGDDVTFYPRDRRGITDLLPYLVSAVPAVSDDKLFVPVGNALYAIDIYNGKRMYVYPKYGRSKKSSRSQPAPNTFCTVHDGVAYFISATQSVDMRGNYLDGMVHAIDINSGIELWNSRKQTKLVPENRNDKLSGEYRFSGTVVPYKDGVLFLAQRIEGFHPNFYLVCADAKTGEEKWCKFIATRRGMGSPYSQPVMMDYIVLDDDVAYIAMSSGTLLAVDLISHEEKWITEYNQEYYFGDTRSSTSHYRNNSDPRYWRVNHPIIYNGNIIFAPKDSNYIFCFDGRNGKVLWSVYMPQLRYIAGLDEDDGKLFCLAKHRGQEKLIIIDVETSKKIIYMSPNTAKLDLPVGRPALTKSAIYISNKSGLIKFDRKTETFTKILAWEHGKTHPSNVVAIKSGLYLVNTMEIIAFNDPLIEETLSEAIKKNPDDMALRYKLARAVFDNGKLVDAAAKYKFAFDKVSHELAFNGSPLFERIGDELNTCCERLIDESLARGDTKTALKYAQLGFEVAVNPNLQARSSMALGRVYDFAKNGVESVKTYRKAITDTPEVMYDIGGGVQQSSHYFATARIGELITKYGRGCYTAVDAEAAKASVDVMSGIDEKAHIAFYGKYPNSLAANKVMMHLVDIYEKSERTSLGLVVCKKMAYRTIPAADNVDALLGLYRLSSIFGEYVSQIYALERLAKLPAEVVADIDGTQKNVAVFAAEQLVALRAAEAIHTKQSHLLSNKPKEQFALDLKIATRDKKNNSAQFFPRILAPKGREPEIMSGRTITVNMGVLRCWDVATGKIVWVNGTPNVWFGLVYSTSLHIRGVMPGSPAQKAGIKSSQIIYKINGQEVKSNTDLAEVLDTLQPGDKAVLTCGNSKKVQDYELVAKTTPPDMTPYCTWEFYMGNNRLIVQYQGGNLTELKCIDLKTGMTIWRRMEKIRPVWNRTMPCGSNLGAVVHYEYSKNNISLFDMTTGKNVVEHDPIKFFYNTINVAGDCYVIINRSTQRGSRAKECQIRDILTNKMRCKVFLGENVYETTEIAGERLLLLRDGKQKSRILDLHNCTVIKKVSEDSNLETITSDKYVMQYRQRPPSVHVYNVKEGKHVGDFQPTGVIQKVVMNGDNLLLVTKSGDRWKALLYDMKNSKPLWDKNIEGVSNIHRADIAGKYVVFTSLKTSKNKPSTVVATVFDIEKGTLVTRVERNTQINRAEQVVASMRNGRLVLLIGESMLILK